MLIKSGNTLVELGEGEIKLYGERPTISLPNEAKVILRIFWSEPERCKVLYDKQNDCIYIIPIKKDKGAIIDIFPAPAGARAHLTLHEAISVVIYDNGNEQMKPSQILQEIVSRNLYLKRDGNYPSLSQIHARISNYPNLFRRTDEGITLTDEGIELAKRTKAKAGLS